MSKNNLLNFRIGEFEFKIPSYTPLELKMIENFEKDDLISSYLPEYKNYFEETTKALKNGNDLFRYTYVVYKDNIPIGMISLFDIQSEMVFSYGILSEHRGKGYANKIKNAVYEYVFSNFSHIQRILGYIDVTNANSLKSLSKSSGYEIKKISDLKTGKEFFEIITYNPYYLKEKEQTRS